MRAFALAQNGQHQHIGPGSRQDMTDDLGEFLAFDTRQNLARRGLARALQALATAGGLGGAQLGDFRALAR